MAKLPMDGLIDWHGVQLQIFSVLAPLQGAGSNVQNDPDLWLEYCLVKATSMLARDDVLQQLAQVQAHKQSACGKLLEEAADAHPSLLCKERWRLGDCNTLCISVVDSSKCSDFTGGHSRALPARNLLTSSHAQ